MLVLSTPSDGQVLTFNSTDGRCGNHKTQVVELEQVSTVEVNGTEITDPDFIDGDEVTFSVSTSEVTPTIADGAIAGAKLTDATVATSKITDFDASCKYSIRW